MEKRRTNTAVWMEKQNRWRVVVQKDGVRRSFYSSTPGRKGQREANAKADEWLDDNLFNGNMKVNELYDKWLETTKITIGRGRYEQKRSIGKTWILPKLGHKKMSTIHEQHFQDILNAAYAKGLSYLTLRSIRGIILEFLKFCRKSNATTLRPEYLTIPKDAPVKEKHILQPEDLIILFHQDKTMYYNKEIVDPLIYAYRLQVVLGLRPGELLGLKRSDITDDYIYIRRSKNILDEITPGKNKNAIRHFAQNNLSRELFQKQFEMMEPDSEYLFEDIREKKYYHRWVTYCKHNGISHVTPYELRHTFISLIKTLPEGQVKALVGHSKNMDTFGIYGHTVTGEMEKTAQDVERIFTDILNTHLNTL